jgi:hypothetical protein
MKRSRRILLLTAAGLLAATTAAGAAGLTTKVAGLLRKDVKVAVDGTVTGMEPVFINGKAYLPAREAAAELGYDLSWNGKNKRLDLRNRENIILTPGVIESVTPIEGGQVSFELLGKAFKGNSGRVILHTDAGSSVTDDEGRASSVQALKAGMHVTVEYGPVVTDSVPARAAASKIVTGQLRLVREDVIRDVQLSDGDARIVFGNGEGGTFTPDLVLNLGKETSVSTSDGQSVPWSALTKGMRVRAYYGPALMKSMPPQSPADMLVILETNK